MEKITTLPNITLKQAMKKLSLGGEKCLVIVNDENMLLGTLSDGDLRKAILNGVPFSDSIEEIYQKNPTFLFEGMFDKAEIKKLFIENKFDLIPVADKNKHLVDIILWESIFSKDKNKQNIDINVPVVIMAGGKGTRLEPFTKILPKPLIPIHDKTILEHIIDRFLKIGCDDFYMTVNYKGKILKAYYEELNPRYSMKFMDEKNPLGTAGSLKYFEGKFIKSFFVSNCDIIINEALDKIHKFHIDGDYDLTLVASAKEYIIPYGTCELNDDGNLSHISEKPSFDFLINTGLYILKPELLQIIPKDTFYHITDLIRDASKNGKKIGVFPIDEEQWIDIGQWAEYHKAIEQL